ncbi:MAG: methionine biosynthesis protein MetW [Candidatus Omnitrophica bacterium]|nr:methionine biosynthesis protein MetW [Candidatus Omnitrophota bacterium]
MTKEAKRPDHEVIYGIVEPGSRVLDLGCGEGDLLYLLTKGKGVKAQGVELSEAAIYKCVEKGLSVFHGDIDSGLNDYPDRSFDYVILNQSMQEVKKVDFVIDEALRVGGRVIVGFPNFAYWRARLRLFLKGKTPVTYSLPYRWYNTPNLHFLSISDFKEFCADKGITIESEHFLGRNGTSRFLPNIFALNAVFVIKAGNKVKGG